MNYTYNINIIKYTTKKPASAYTYIPKNVNTTIIYTAPDYSNTLSTSYKYDKYYVVKDYIIIDSAVRYTHAAL